tara:strand:+ start:286 stop:516 length:231 start_codon:yes stop_codon:yes gene_type:complete
MKNNNYLYLYSVGVAIDADGITYPIMEDDSLDFCMDVPYADIINEEWFDGLDENDQYILANWLFINNIEGGLIKCS